MKEIKYFIILILLISCYSNNYNRIRIVDSEGEAVKINKIVPQFNEEQLRRQKQAFAGDKQNSIRFINENSNITQQINDSNIFVGNGSYIDDSIFEDRITNFNYIENKNNIQNNKNDNKNNILVYNKNNKNTKNNKNNKDNEDNKIINKSENKNIIQQTSKKNEIQEVGVKNNKILKLDSKKNTKKENLNSFVSNNEIKNNKNTLGKYYIQIGVFSDKSNAELSYSKYSKISNGIIDGELSKGKTLYTVLLGPYSNRNIAEQNLEKVIKTGHYDVFIVEKK